MMNWFFDGRAEQVFWARQVPAEAILAAFVAVVLLTVFLYRRGQGLPPRVRLVLALSRLVTLAMIVAVVLEPTVAIEQTHELRRRLAVLIDDSGSMSVADQRKRPEDIVEAATALGMLPLSETPEVNGAVMALDAKQRRTIAAAREACCHGRRMRRSSRSEMISTSATTRLARHCTSSVRAIPVMGEAGPEILSLPCRPTSRERP